MKKIFLILLFPAVLSLSCSEDINPNAQFRERYVMNCILNGDSSKQIVTILKTYKTENFDPLSNSENPFIKNADVKLWHKNKLYQFSDSSISSSGTQRYEGENSFYFNKDLRLEPDEYADIEALLPNGLRLSAELKMPSGNISFSGSDDQIPNKTKGDIINIVWNHPEELMFSPKFVIKYFDFSSGSAVQKIIEVPVKYISINGKEEPYYPKPSANKGCRIDLDVFNKTLMSIAPDEKSRNAFTILGFSVIMQIYDENLSLYFNSIQNSSDKFTVNLNENNYTNIKGGYGIFGAFITKEHKILLDRDYIKSLGFKTGF